MEITAIILTGGQSRRMGTDKALLQFKGRTLLDRAIDTCLLVCSEIIISSDVAAHERNGCIRVEDEIKNCGPIGGIYSCLRQSSNEWNFVLSVDTPYISPDFIQFLKSHTKGCEAVVPIHKNKKEPLIAFYHQNNIPAFQMQLETEQYKMQFLLEQLSTCYVDSESRLVSNPKLFHNLNFPEDLGA